MLTCGRQVVKYAFTNGYRWLLAPTIAEPMVGGTCPPYTRAVDVVRAHRFEGVVRFCVVSDCGQWRRNSAKIPEDHAFACQSARTKGHVWVLCARVGLVWDRGCVVMWGCRARVLGKRRGPSLVGRASGCRACLRRKRASPIPSVAYRFALAMGLVMMRNGGGSHHKRWARPSTLAAWLNHFLCIASARALLQTSPRFFWSSRPSPWSCSIMT